jgi:predicted Holliday junction resolvase-like endonuclease
MFVLLIALVVWAFGITILYAQLVRTIKKLVASDSESIHALLDCNTWMTQLIKETVDATDSLHNLVLQYTEKMQEELEKNEQSKKFAMDTIQQARRLYNTIQANIAPEVIEEEGEQNNG